jgi:hypothetical protein
MVDDDLGILDGPRSLPLNPVNLREPPLLRAGFFFVHRTSTKPWLNALLLNAGKRRREDMPASNDAMREIAKVLRRPCSMRRRRRRSSSSCSTRAPRLSGRCRGAGPRIDATLSGK